ncbi:EamA family transporter [Ramlibacter sp. G-1-2-2]|uniref:EamA family transporter n=1 Tax=Ramlibacter agri TaxID=2728837 RepID=A0A848H4Y6_9BURK|nr:EamA family transporter [Ramlibacter agri]NML44862.1 EamA family transporter [Ramlibacter agri]
MPVASIIDFVLLAAIWGSSFLFMRLAVVEFGPLAATCARVGIATLLLVPLMLARGLGPQLRKHWKAVFVVGVLNSGLPFLLFAFALLSISTGLSAILNATVPLFGALVAWGWLGDRPTGSRSLGLAVGFLGIVLLAWDKAGIHPNASGIAPIWAVLACLGATVSYAFAASWTKKHLQGLPPLMTATGSQLAATLALALPAATAWPARMPSAQAWIAVTVAGVLCTGIAYILYFRLIENAGPARALTVTYAVPVFAVVYGGLFLGEQITPWMLACGAIIICGTALSSGVLKLPALRASA